MTNSTTRKGQRLNFSALLVDSRYRAEIVSLRLARTDRAAGFKSALKLLRKVLRAVEANSPQASEVADEITVLLLKELQIPASRVRAALPYLELANKIDKASNPRNALIAARKAVIGVILVELPNYFKGENDAPLGNVPLGNALKRKAVKSSKNCDLAEADLARFMALMACIQWVKDDCNTGHACKAADHLNAAANALSIRPNWSVASITNIVNGVTAPISEVNAETEPEPAEMPCLTPNAETVAAIEAARAGELEKVASISDLFSDEEEEEDEEDPSDNFQDRYSD